MERDRFRRLVQRAVRSLPRDFRGYLDNVEVVIAREPGREDLASVDGGARPERNADLFGLYVGVPLTAREGGGGGLPDRIVIFQGPLERHFPPRELAVEIQRTVMHELAHHFGIDDERLHELGMG